MNTKDRLRRFAEERDMYLQECRMRYGYKARARVHTIGASATAGFISAFFGSVLTLYAFSHYDVAPLVSFIKSLQYVSAGDLLALITSRFTG
jgi:hypothetical protein